MVPTRRVLALSFGVWSAGTTITTTALLVPNSSSRRRVGVVTVTRGGTFSTTTSSSSSQLGLFGFNNDLPATPSSWLTDLMRDMAASNAASSPSVPAKSLEQQWADMEASLNLDLGDYIPSAMKSLGLGSSSSTPDNSITFTLNPPAWLAQCSSLLEGLQQSYAHLPLLAQVALALTPIVAVVGATLYQLSFPPDNYRSGLEPYPRGKYDPLQAKIFYANYPLVVVQRSLQLVRLSNQFLVGLWMDKYLFKTHEDPTQRTKRADELLQLITKLGPTAIKVGQALSVRPDIIPKEYATSLATLQDQVPPFSSKDARDIVQRELGTIRFDQLQGMATKDPVASASIGQVYKATLEYETTTMANNNNDDTKNNRGGGGGGRRATTTTTTQVAIKVQRPNVLSDIALDLYIVREFAPWYQKYIAKSTTDLQTLANEWGRGFIAELDYRAEAANTIRFNTEMKKRKLDAVMAPVVIPEYSTEQILVTEWVDGVRIDQSDEDDIPRLCSVALNAYLVMLLELRSLHCDPHPGNLLRTTDGRLCILDFGMTLEVDPTLQYSLLEYIAHCTSDDYDRVPEDLVNMGFLKPEKLDYAKRSGILEPLKYFLREAGKGGGAKGVRDRVLADFQKRYPGLEEEELRKAARAEMKSQMKQAAQKESIATGITTEVEELQRRNRDAFTIPPWFVYTSRAFGTLEGVSLQADENYSLIQSCFPYIAKRLVGDDNPRAQKALKDILYGAGDNVDVTRLRELADGFSKYTTTTKTLNTIDDLSDGKNGSLSTTTKTTTTTTSTKDAKAKLVEAQAAITLAKDSADVFLAPEGNLVQNMLLQETTLAASARFKDQLRETLVDGPQKFRDSLPFGVGNFLPPLPVEAVAPFVKKTATEEKAQQLIDKLSKMVPQPVSNMNVTSKGGDGAAAKKTNGNGLDTDALNALVSDLEPEQAAFLVKELRENLPKYAPMVGQLGSKFLASLLQKASDNIETTLTELDAVSNDDPLLKAAAKGLSNAASRGATALQQQRQEQQKGKGIESTSGKDSRQRSSTLMR